MGLVSKSWNLAVINHLRYFKNVTIFPNKLNFFIYHIIIASQNFESAFEAIFFYWLCGFFLSFTFHICFSCKGRWTTNHGILWNASLFSVTSDRSASSTLRPNQTRSASWYLVNLWVTFQWVYYKYLCRQSFLGHPYHMAQPS